MLKHKGEPLLTCSLCDFTAKIKHKMDSHMLTHKVEKPLPTPTSEYEEKFSVADSSVCTNPADRPFPCSLCDYNARDQSKLNRHMLTHTGERPFGCSLCQYRTTQ